MAKDVIADFFSDWISDSDEDQLLLAEEGALYEVSEKLHIALKESNLTRKELADKLGKSPAYITRVLKGNHNLTVKTLASILFVLGKNFTLNLIEQNKNEEDEWEYLDHASNILVMSHLSAAEKKEILDSARVVERADNDQYIPECRIA
ncbi:MAG: helix-turn-helix transcriptional regulator [Idiomarina sp.]|nr:helix-turn-helix transcriptional regulator [Idiomarina sp.]